MLFLGEQDTGANSVSLVEKVRPLTGYGQNRYSRNLEEPCDIMVA